MVEGRAKIVNHKFEIRSIEYSVLQAIDCTGEYFTVEMKCILVTERLSTFTRNKAEGKLLARRAPKSSPNRHFAPGSSPPAFLLNQCLYKTSCTNNTNLKSRHGLLTYKSRSTNNHSLPSKALLQKWRFPQVNNPQPRASVYKQPTYQILDSTNSHQTQIYPLTSKYIHGKPAPSASSPTSSPAPFPHSSRIPQSVHV